MRQRIAQWGLLLVILWLAGCALAGETPSAPVMEAQPGGTSSESVMVSTGGLMEKLDLEALTSMGQVILVGKVEALQSRWNDDRSLILTDVRLSVEQVVKGSADQKEITVVVPGGQVGDVGQTVSAVPRFAEGERVLLFLERDEKGAFQVVGGLQGKKAIEGDIVMDLDMSLEDAVARIKALP